VAGESSDDIMKIGNKFRACVMFADETSLNPETFHKDYLIRTYEIFSPFLTYVAEGGKELTHPTSPIVNSEPNTFWISDIDLWVGLPPELKKKMLTLGSHVMCFDRLGFVNEL
jgi:hypothetical protein